MDFPRSNGSGKGEEQIEMSARTGIQLVTNVSPSSRISPKIPFSSIRSRKESTVFCQVCKRPARHVHTLFEGNVEIRETAGEFSDPDYLGDATEKVDQSKQPVDVSGERSGIVAR